MKRTPLRRKSKSPQAKLERQLWELCRKVCYHRDKKEDGSIDCYTCGACNIEKQNRQLGHLWAKASLGAILKYKIDILRFQCFRCNINFGGNGAIFYAKILKEIGKKKMADIESLKNVLVKASDHYFNLSEEYKNKLKEYEEK